jgi:putative transposase
MATPTPMLESKSSLRSWKTNQPQDHRAVKRITKPMFGFKSFRSARNVLAGVELMHMIRKGQMMMEGSDEMSFAEQFYALA